MPLIDAVLSTVEAANKAAKARKKTEEKQAELKQAQSAANWERLMDVQQQRMRQQKFRQNQREFEAQQKQLKTEQERKAQERQQRKTDIKTLAKWGTETPYKIEPEEYEANVRVFGKAPEQQVSPEQIKQIAKLRRQSGLQPGEAELYYKIYGKPLPIRSKVDRLKSQTEQQIAKDRATIASPDASEAEKKAARHRLVSLGEMKTTGLTPKEKRERQAKIDDLESRGMSEEDATRAVDAGIYKERIERIQSEKEKQAQKDYWAEALRDKDISEQEIDKAVEAGNIKRLESYLDEATEEELIEYNKAMGWNDNVSRAAAKINERLSLKGKDTDATAKGKEIEMRKKYHVNAGMSEKEAHESAVEETLDISPPLTKSEEIQLRSTDEMALIQDNLKNLDKLDWDKEEKFFNDLWKSALNTNDMDLARSIKMDAQQAARLFGETLNEEELWQLPGEAARPSKGATSKSPIPQFKVSSSGRVSAYYPTRQKTKQKGLKVPLPTPRETIEKAINEVGQKVENTRKRVEGMTKPKSIEERKKKLAEEYDKKQDMETEKTTGAPSTWGDWITEEEKATGQKATRKSIPSPVKQAKRLYSSLNYNLFTEEGTPSPREGVERLYDTRQGTTTYGPEPATDEEKWRAKVKDLFIADGGGLVQGKQMEDAIKSFTDMGGEIRTILPFLNELGVTQEEMKSNKALMTNFNRLTLPKTEGRRRGTQEELSPPTRTEGPVNIGEVRGAVNKYSSIIKQKSDKYNVDANLLKAVIFVESSGNPNAESRVGAQGLMQLMPTTAQVLDVKDPFDPDQNIEGGARYLGRMLKKFGNVKTALEAYNAGITRAEEGDIPQETVDYVNKVLRIKRQLDLRQRETT